MQNLQIFQKNPRYILDIACQILCLIKIPELFENNELHTVKRKMLILPTAT